MSSRFARIVAHAAVGAVMTASCARAAIDFARHSPASFDPRHRACGDLEPTWFVTAFYTNSGLDDFRGDLEVVFFQDLDGNGLLTPGDVELARVTSGLFCPPFRRCSATMLLVGHLPYPELPVWICLDPDDLIPESDETNNTYLGGYPCAADAANLIPLADLSLAITSVDVRLAPSPSCSCVATITARAANFGSLDPGMTVTA